MTWSRVGLHVGGPWSTALGTRTVGLHSGVNWLLEMVSHRSYGMTRQVRAIRSLLSTSASDADFWEHRCMIDDLRQPRYCFHASKIPRPSTPLSSRPMHARPPHCTVGETSRPASYSSQNISAVNISLSRDRIVASRNKREFRSCCESNYDFSWQKKIFPLWKIHSGIRFLQ